VNNPGSLLDMQRDGRTTHPPKGSASSAFLLAQVGGLAAQRFAERLSSLGLSPAQAGLVRVVAAGPGRTQQAVSAQLGMLPSRLVVLVDELEKSGVIERRRDPDDRRSYALHVTPAGQQVLGEIGTVARAHNEDFLEPLDEVDRATLTDLLSRLAAHHQLTPHVHPGYRTLGRRP
jgi:DNA-binding MarR family transcriptional regulator